MPVHFLDLAAAVEKLRWAEKEWRELDRELAEPSGEGVSLGSLTEEEEEDADEDAELVQAVRG